MTSIVTVVKVDLGCVRPKRPVTELTKPFLFGDQMRFVLLGLGWCQLFWKGGQTKIPLLDLIHIGVFRGFWCYGKHASH